jgi:hypothetical protein
MGKRQGIRLGHLDDGVLEYMRCKKQSCVQHLELCQHPGPTPNLIFDHNIINPHFIAPRNQDDARELANSQNLRPICRPKHLSQFPLKLHSA